MATNADIIKQFLVELGYKIDDVSQKKFTNTIAIATSNVLKLGSAVATTTLSLETMIIRVSSNLERLYFAASRTDALVQGLQAIEYSAGRIGVTAQQASSAIEGFARALRTQPGLIGMLQSAGIMKPGERIESTFLSFLTRLHAMPFAFASQVGAMFGQDSDTLFMILKNLPEFAEGMDKFANKQEKAGINAELIANRAHNLMNALRDLDADLGITGDRLVVDLGKPAQNAVEWVDKLIAKINELDKSLHGLLVGPGAVIGASGAGLLLTRLLFGAGAAGVGLGALGAASIAAGAYMLYDPEGVKNFFGGDEFSDHSRHNPGNLRKWAGYPSDSAGFAVFPNDTVGLEKLARQFAIYGSRGLDTIAKINAVYLDSRKDNIPASNMFMSQATGFGINERLDMSDPDTLLKLLDAKVRNEQGTNMFSKDFERQAVATALGGGRNVTLNQKTEINVTATGSADDLARSIGAEQTRVNGDLARYLESNFR